MPSPLVLAANSLLRQRAFEVAREVLRTVPIDKEGFTAAQVRIIDSYNIQGRLGEADRQLAIALAENVPNETRLALHLLSLLGKVHGGSFKSASEKLIDKGEEILESEVFSRWLRAFVKDILNRNDLARISMGLLNGRELLRIRQELSAVIQAYENIDEKEAALQARLRLADTYFKEAGGDYFKGVEKQSEVIQQSLTLDWFCLAGAATLRLAEEKLRRAQHSGNEAEREEAIRGFEEGAKLLVKGGRETGEAEAQLQLGELILKFGLSDGGQLIENATGSLPLDDHLISLNGAWATYETYTARTFDPVAAERIASMRKRISVCMESPMLTRISELVSADAKFRSGNLVGARAILDKAIVRNDLYFDWAGLSILATVLGSNNQHEEAAELLEKAIAEQEQIGPTNFLQQTYELLANQWMSVDPLRAVKHYQQAIEVAVVLGDTRAEGSLRGTAAYCATLARYRQQKLPILTDEIEDEFKRSTNLLLQFRDQDGVNLLCNVCQYRAQAAMFSKDHDATMFWFEQTLANAEIVNLTLVRGATLSMMVMAEISRGRRGSIEAFRAAAGYAERSVELFTNSGLRNMRWKALFHRGMTWMEAARLMERGTTAHQEAQDQAAVDYEQAAGEVADLRRLSSNQVAATRQQEIGFFGVDKQTFLRAGFLFHLQERRDYRAAMTWLERTKGQSLLDGIASNSPDLAPDQIANTDVSYDELRALLVREEERSGKRTLLVAYFCDQEFTYAVGIRADWETPAVERILLPYPSFNGFVNDHFRRTAGVRTLLEDIGEGPWQSFRKLVIPIALWSAPGDRIGLVPHGILHDLPLHTLKLNDDYLLVRNPVFYAPSLAVWRHAVQSPQVQKTTSLSVFGDPTGDLPFALREAEQVARTQVQSELLTGSEVTPRSILEGLVSGKNIHYAGHADLAVKDGFQSSLRLSGSHQLRAADVLTVSCQSSLVFMSGCETGLSQHYAGDELFGLVHALLYGGVPNLIVSQWEVQDEATAALVVSFYFALANNGGLIAEALRSAVIEQKANFPERSFYYWAPFVAVGRG